MDFSLCGQGYFDLDLGPKCDNIEKGACVHVLVIVIQSPILSSRFFINLMWD